MQRPAILEEVGFDIYLDTRKLKDIPLPVKEMDIEKLIWAFNYPVWEKDGTDDWNLTPQEVIDQKEGTSEHRLRVESVDLEYPLIVIFNKERWVTLDGIHRLVKAFISGDKTVKVKILTKDDEYFKQAQINK